MSRTVKEHHLHYIWMSQRGWQINHKHINHSNKSNIKIDFQAITIENKQNKTTFIQFSNS